LDRARKAYNLSPRVLQRLLPFVRHKRVQARSRTWLLFDKLSLESFLVEEKLGKFYSLPPDPLDEYLTLPQALELSGLSRQQLWQSILWGRIKARKNAASKLLIENESLRAETARRFRENRKFERDPKYLWLFPPTRRELSLFQQFINVARAALKHARKHGIQLEPDWLGKLMHEIHEREKQEKAG